MKLIQSSHNPAYRELLRLAQGKGEAGQVLLEGVHLCQEWLRHRGLPELALFDVQRLQLQPELQALRAQLQDVPVLVCAPSLIKGLTQVQAPQGVFFRARVAAPDLPQSLTANSLWLDRIQDPGNMGALLRTAAAAGVEEVYASPGCAHAWSPKVLRAAQGAHFFLRVHVDVDLDALCARLRVPLLVTALEDAGSLYGEPLPPACAWVFGNEGQGVRASLLARASRRVFIPQAAGAESLNVTVAAGICLFEQKRQHP
jgi:TrmH family RNA methyltransferase